VFSDFQAHGLLPSDHPCYGGTYHKMSDLAAADARPDLVLALGVRFGLFTMGTSDRLVPTAAKLIHVEMDPKEIGRLRDVAVPVVADSREMLLALDAHTKSTRWPDWNPWIKTIQDAKVARRQRASEDLRRTAPPIHPYQAVAALAENLPPDCTVVGDGAEAYHWLNEVIHQKRAGSYLTHGFLGAVGFGLGLALGAQVAQPKRPVLCLAGDGAIGFTIAEFDTMVKHGLPIVVLIMNNRSWGASQHFQEMVSGRDKVIGTRLGGAKYHDVAAAFGARGVHITGIASLGPAIREAFASGQPTCINVEVDVAPFPPELLLLMERH
jgi:acetolactate synthase-1/2/3 large subunit